MSTPVLSQRALNRVTLARQGLLEPMQAASTTDADEPLGQAERLLGHVAADAPPRSASVAT